MLMASSERIQVLSESKRVPADGSSSTRVCIRLPKGTGESLTLRLSKCGSFEATTEVREASYPVIDGEVNVTIFSPRRPGSTFLLGPGIRHRIEFGAATHLHAIIYEWVPTLAWALVLALVLRNFAIASYFIPSGSMESTLMPGDLLIAEKFSYKILGNEPQRGDVMIFVYPGNDERGKPDFIKRIIGLPGDRVEVNEGIVYVNGEALDEPYIKEQAFSDFPETQVPEGHYFALGDNRNHSRDSRAWGFVPRKNLEGRALFVFWPFNRAKLMQHVDYAPVATAHAAHE
jgi:signal peptidase I